MTIRKRVRNCILHYFQLLLLVSFLNLSFEKKKKSVHISYFGESIFTTVVMPKRWGREVSQIADDVRNIRNIDFPVRKWNKLEKEWNLFFILQDECNCSIKLNLITYVRAWKWSVNDTIAFIALNFMCFQMSPQRGSMEICRFCWRSETARID